MASYKAGGHLVLFFIKAILLHPGSICVAELKWSSADLIFPLAHSTAAKAACASTQNYIIESLDKVAAQLQGNKLGEKTDQL